jgi:hypothetical protein
MLIKVKETRIYLVPELLEADVREAIKSRDTEYLDELIGSMEDHEGPDEVITESAVEIREDGKKQTKAVRW